MKRKDFIIVAVVVVIAAGLFAYWKLGRTVQPVRGTPAGTLEMLPLEPAKTPEPDTQKTAGIFNILPGAYADEVLPTPTPIPEPRPTLYPAESYLRVVTNSGEYDLIPLITDAQFKLTQGENMENVIEIGVNSVKMHSSTCDNQDCVNQGEITLENRDERVLFDMIICLPNQVMLQLLSAEEAQTLWESYNE